MWEITIPDAEAYVCHMSVEERRDGSMLHIVNGNTLVSILRPSGVAWSELALRSGPQIASMTSSWILLCLFAWIAIADDLPGNASARAIAIGAWMIDRALETARSSSVPGRNDRFDPRSPSAAYTVVYEWGRRAPIGAVARWRLAFRLMRNAKQITTCTGDVAHTWIRIPDDPMCAYTHQGMVIWASTLMPASFPRVAGTNINALIDWLLLTRSGRTPPRWLLSHGLGVRPAQPSTSVVSQSDASRIATILRSSIMSSIAPRVPITDVPLPDPIAAWMAPWGVSSVRIATHAAGWWALCLTAQATPTFRLWWRPRAEDGCPISVDPPWWWTIQATLAACWHDWTCHRIRLERTSHSGRAVATWEASPQTVSLFAAPPRVSR